MGERERMRTNRRELPRCADTEPIHLIASVLPCHRGGGALLPKVPPLHTLTGPLPPPSPGCLLTSWLYSEHLLSFNNAEVFAFLKQDKPQPALLYLPSSLTLPSFLAASQLKVLWLPHPAQCTSKSLEERV